MNSEKFSAGALVRGDNGAVLSKPVDSRPYRIRHHSPVESLSSPPFDIIIIYLLWDIVNAII